MENYYIIHSVFKIKNLIKILEDGEIRIGKNLDKKYLSMSNPKEPLNYIFSNIYFEKLKNLEYFWQSSIVLDPKIIIEKGCIFKKSWSGDIIHKDDIKIKKNDNKLKEKIKKIYYYIKKPKDIPAIVKMNPYMTHEILFNDKISIKKYAIMITCNFCDDKTYKKLEKIIEKKKYNVVLKKGNSPMPTYKQIIERKINME